jgi:hypothetical protein
MKPFTKNVFLTGLIAGTLDLASAFLVQFLKTGNFPTKLLHYIAGGAVGLDTSMKGGIEMILLGLFFHYFIAFSFTLFFFLVFPKVSFLQQNKYLTAFLYGIFISLVMELVVLPLSLLPLSSTINWTNKIIATSVLILALGVPISLHAFSYFQIRHKNG